ncbi:MAG TPA: hypothetical protein VGV37_06140 [Aliidongia sp.]|uniref:hypothetical protein n=1 Tax=Aliidongia sp. TaxID=1914230 RepID=UPI002DDD7BAD|nr:hypothetical protein [Aliidongia sp.]HEV2674104.1 hypothetical protein [Aliidongia sp.]
MSALPKISPTIGHNSGAAPLSEMLTEETSGLAARSNELVAATERAKVSDADTAGRATTLAKMLKEHAKKIDETRKVRKEPFLEDGRTVDRHFQALAAPVVEAADRVVKMIDQFRREEEAKAAAERRRLEEEARRQREAAEAAERARIAAEAQAQRERDEAQRLMEKAQREAAASEDRAAREQAQREAAQAQAKIDSENAAARQRALQAEIDNRNARDAAEELVRQAQATTAAPIASDYGIKASGRKVFTAEIIDLTAAIRHARKIDEAAVRDAVQKIFDRQVRAGVRDLPGATVTESSTTVIR